MGRGPRRLSLLGPIDGKLLVDRSRDPECDAARALVAMASPASSPARRQDGHPRIIIDIEKAAKLRTVEESVKGLRFKPYREMGSGEGYSLETGWLDRRSPQRKKRLLDE